LTKPISKRFNKIVEFFPISVSKEVNEMKKVLFITLCIFFALATVVSSAEFYNCVDKDGNTFITDNPPEDAKCESNEGDNESTNQQQQKSDVENQKTKQDDETPSEKGEIKRLIKIPRPGY
jgi:hypothetical protein